MPPKPTVLSVAELRKLKGAQRDPVVVYFTEAERKNLTRGARPSRGRVPNDALTLQVVELPDGGGLGVIRCPVFKLTFKEGETHCVPAPEDPEPGGGSASAAEFCALLFAADGSARCAGRCSTRGESCRLGAWPVPALPGQRASGIVMLACGCARG